MEIHSVFYKDDAVDIAENATVAASGDLLQYISHNGTHWDS